MTTQNNNSRTFIISLNEWENLFKPGFEEFDPSSDCKILNYDEEITDGNYLLEIETSNKEAIQFFTSREFVELI